MVCENPVEQTKGMNDSGFIAPNPAQQTMGAPETGIASESTPSRQSVDSSIKRKSGQESVAEKNHSQPANYYNYYYPGYRQPSTQSNDGRDHSSAGMHGNNQGSMAYYMPGYNPYTAGAYIGADGQYVNQAFYTSSAFPVTYGTESLPCYAWDYSHTRDASNGSNSTLGGSNSTPSPTTRVRSNGIKPWQLYGPGICKGSTMSSNAKSSQPVTTTTANVSQPKFGAQPLKPLNKSSSNFQSSGYANVYRPMENFQSSFNKQGSFANNGAMGYRPNTRIWNNGNDKQKFNKKSEHETSTELTRGPRIQTRSGSSSSEKDTLELAVKKESYNLPDFQTEYEVAKFYVIKSYSEDDVHRCLKYDVWSSTANGNKKLDAAFHDAEVKSSESGTKCPIFLFFSVNSSGQFVGVAEMMGKVDFNKNMDFWQLDKWNGFFPVKWHIVKDVPNPQLRHILLENNDNRPVTYTRDTQEIGLKQGLEMLKIFKNYLAKTSLLDDFEFYEDREKAIQTRRSSKSGVHQTDLYGNGNLSLQLGTEAEGEVGSVSSLVDVTQKLSLNSDPKVVL